MLLSELPRRDLARALNREGLFVHLGPFVLRVRSDIADIPDHMRQFYPHHRVAKTSCAESTVTVSAVRDRRPPWKKLARLLIDEHPFMYPLRRNFAIPMLEWGMNWVIASRAHQYLLVHSAVVEKRGKVALMAAVSGSGKSTLCATLIGAGWRLFSDEFAVVRLSDGLVLPMPRAISLKNQSIDLIRARFPDATFTKNFLHTIKGTLAFMAAPESAVRLSSQAAPLGLIVFPKYDPQIDLQAIELSYAAAHTSLVENSMNYAALGESGFTRTADLVESAPAWRLTYGDSASALAWFEQAAAKF